MSEASAPLARRLAMLSHARHNRRGQRALLRDRVLRVLVADLVAARTAAGMTQHEVAMRMWTTKSAVSRLESGRYARQGAEPGPCCGSSYGAYGPVPLCDDCVAARNYPDFTSNTCTSPSSIT